MGGGWENGTGADKQSGGGGRERSRRHAPLTKHFEGVDGLPGIFPLFRALKVVHVSVHLRGSEGQEYRVEAAGAVREGGRRDTHTNGTRRRFASKKRGLTLVANTIGFALIFSARRVVAGGRGAAEWVAARGEVQGAEALHDGPAPGRGNAKQAQRRRCNAKRRACRQV